MTTGTYLDKILPQTREDLNDRMSAQPLKEVKARVRDAEDTRDYFEALAEDRLHLIAEVKRASPSKGDLAPDIDAAELARVYVDNGASALSVLTDRPFFKGSLDDLKAVREVTSESGTPILRKDFVIDEYMVYEARLWGADAILLLVIGLSDLQLQDYQGLANELGMAALIETHDELELYRALEIKPRNWSASTIVICARLRLILRRRTALRRALAAAAASWRRAASSTRRTRAA